MTQFNAYRSLSSMYRFLPLFVTDLSFCFSLSCYNDIIYYQPICYCEIVLYPQNYINVTGNDKIFIIVHLLEFTQFQLNKACKYTYCNRESINIAQVARYNSILLYVISSPFLFIYKTMCHCYHWNSLLWHIQQRNMMK